MTKAHWDIDKNLPELTGKVRTLANIPLSIDVQRKPT